jgi:hypothetical protein
MLCHAMQEALTLALKITQRHNDPQLRKEEEAHFEAWHCPLSAMMDRDKHDADAGCNSRRKRRSSWCHAFEFARCCLAVRVGELWLEGFPLFANRTADDSCGWQKLHSVFSGATNKLVHVWEKCVSLLLAAEVLTRQYRCVHLDIKPQVRGVGG